VIDKFKKKKATGAMNKVQSAQYLNTGYPALWKQFHCTSFFLTYEFHKWRG